MHIGLQRFRPGNVLWSADSALWHLMYTMTGMLKSCKLSKYWLSWWENCYFSKPTVSQLVFLQDKFMFKTALVYPNRNLGQYLTTGRFFFPVLAATFVIEGVGGCGCFSCSLSVIVNPCSVFSCEFVLGRKCVDTCCDFTLGLDPIFAFPLLLSATNHSLPVRWFLWITEAYVL